MTAGLISLAGCDPADMTRTCPSASWSSRTAAIWDRPALWTQTNSTCGTSVMSVAFPWAPSHQRAAGPVSSHSFRHRLRVRSAAGRDRGDRRFTGFLGAASAAYGRSVAGGPGGAVAPAGCRCRVVAVEALAVGQDGVDLPGLAARGALDPELVLLGVAAGGVPLISGGKPGPGEAGLLGFDGVDVGDFDAQVVEGAPLAGAFQQDQLQRRLGDREVRITGAALGRLRAEQPAVEGDGLVDVVDVQRELHTGHGNLQGLKTLMSVYVLPAAELVTRHRGPSI